MFYTVICRFGTWGLLWSVPPLSWVFFLTTADTMDMGLVHISYSVFTIYTSKFCFSIRKRFRQLLRGKLTLYVQIWNNTLALIHNAFNSYQVEERQMRCKNLACNKWRHKTCKFISKLVVTNMKMLEDEIRWPYKYVSHFLWPIPFLIFMLYKLEVDVVCSIDGKMWCWRWG